MLLAEPIRARTGWDWYALGLRGTAALTLLIIGINLLAAWAWQKARMTGDLARKLQRVGLCALGLYFLGGGWLTYAHFRRSPELAKEPYPFLNGARIRKGLPPTADGLSHDPVEVARERVRRKLKLSADERRLLESNP